jgi:predicted transcriptional regulator
MASSALSPVQRAEADALAAQDEDYPVPPEWLIADPEENKRHILALLEQGERDIAAGRTRDAEDVFRDADDIITAALLAGRARK